MLAAYSSLPCGVFVLNEDRHLHFTHDLDATTYVTECSSGNCCKRHEGLTAQCSLMDQLASQYKAEPPHVVHDAVGLTQPRHYRA